IAGRETVDVDHTIHLRYRLDRETYVRQEPNRPGRQLRTKRAVTEQIGRIRLTIGALGVVQPANLVGSVHPLRLPEREDHPLLVLNGFTEGAEPFAGRCGDNLVACLVEVVRLQHSAGIYGETRLGRETHDAR